MKIDFYNQRPAAVVFNSNSWENTGCMVGALEKGWEHRVVFLCYRRGAGQYSRREWAILSLVDTRTSRRRILGSAPMRRYGIRADDERGNPVPCRMVRRDDRTASVRMGSSGSASVLIAALADRSLLFRVPFGQRDTDTVTGVHPWHRGFIHHHRAHPPTRAVGRKR